MMVPRTKPGLKGDEMVEIININAPPEIIRSVRSSAIFLPAHHRNKEHWVTIRLDGTVSKEDVFLFLN
ncbi:MULTISPECIES: hypothetical protein [Dickeya]|uniref:hypothetical protein n=1 Tax=Dickeya sp. DW 0440 TaxID=1225785 RepID=UPI000A03529A